MLPSTVHPHEHGDLLDELVGLVEELWFIPINMGNSPRIDHPYSIRAVHPHHYGELATVLQIVRGVVGSSPLKWGTRGQHTIHLGGDRFIPIIMGNSNNCFTRRWIMTVHPHEYGELYDTETLHGYCRGSSP